MYYNTVKYIVKNKKKMKDNIKRHELWGYVMRIVNTYTPVIKRVIHLYII